MQRDDKNIAEIQKRIGERLKELRIDRGYTNYEHFAFSNDVSRSNYGKYENGHNMRMDTFIHILTALDISFQDFFSDFHHAPATTPIPDTESE